MYQFLLTACNGLCKPAPFHCVSNGIHGFFQNLVFCCSCFNFTHDKSTPLTKYSVKAFRSSVVPLLHNHHGMAKINMVSLLKWSKPLFNQPSNFFSCLPRHSVNKRMPGDWTLDRPYEHYWHAQNEWSHLIRMPVHDSIANFSLPFFSHQGS